MSELLQYTFFQHALVAVTLMSLLCGMVGTYIVARRLVFISGGIAHASLGGVGLGAYFGFPPLGGAALFALFSGVSIRWLSRWYAMREDSAIAMLWTLGMSVGIICAYLSPAFMPELPSYLFGNILTVTRGDLVVLCMLTAVAALLFICLLRPIVAVAFDYDFARSQHLPAAFIEYVLIALVALTIVCCLRLVGIVLAISLLSVPQMTANLFTHDFRRMILLSSGMSWICCLGGLACSCWLNIPSGASIIFLSILFYLLCKAIKKVFDVLIRKSCP